MSTPWFSPTKTTRKVRVFNMPGNSPLPRWVRVSSSKSHILLARATLSAAVIAGAAVIDALAAKLGAPVIRIFAGKQDTGGHRREEVTDWMVRDISECVSHGERHGVIVAIQNHNDFLRTAAEAVEIVARVNSPWFGLILDTGSFQAGDPYEQIALAAPRAVSWQIKERIVAHGVEQPIDLDRIVAIIRQTGYRGYLPIETLGAGDPREKVRGMLRALNSSLSR